MTKKEEILNVLKNGEMVETAIAFEVRLNKPYTNRYLKELEEEGKVILRIEEGNVTKRFWRLK